MEKLISNEQSTERENIRKIVSDVDNAYYYYAPDQYVQNTPGVSFDAPNRWGSCGYLSQLTKTRARHYGYKVEMYQIYKMNQARGVPINGTEIHTMAIVTGEYGKYIVDLSYCQFVDPNTFNTNLCLDQHLDSDSGCNVLSHPPLKELLEKGFIECTDESLRIYLRSLTHADYDNGNDIGINIGWVSRCRTSPLHSDDDRDNYELFKKMKASGLLNNPEILPDEFIPSPEDDNDDIPPSNGPGGSSPEPTGGQNPSEPAEAHPETPASAPDTQATTPDKANELLRTLLANPDSCEVPQKSQQASTRRSETRPVVQTDATQVETARAVIAEAQRKAHEQQQAKKQRAVQQVKEQIQLAVKQQGLKKMVRQSCERAKHGDPTMLQLLSEMYPDKKIVSRTHEHWQKIVKYDWDINDLTPYENPNSLGNIAKGVALLPFAVLMQVVTRVHMTSTQKIERQEQMKQAKQQQKEDTQQEINRLKDLADELDVARGQTMLFGNVLFSLGVRMGLVSERSIRNTHHEAEQRKQEHYELTQRIIDMGYDPDEARQYAHDVQIGCRSLNTLQNVMDDQTQMYKLFEYATESGCYTDKYYDETLFHLIATGHITRERVDQEIADRNRVSAAMRVAEEAGVEIDIEKALYYGSLWVHNQIQQAQRQQANTISVHEEEVSLIETEANEEPPTVQVSIQEQTSTHISDSSPANPVIRNIASSALDAAGTVGRKIAGVHVQSIEEVTAQVQDEQEREAARLARMASQTDQNEGTLLDFLINDDIPASNEPSHPQNHSRQGVPSFCPSFA